MSISTTQQSSCSVEDLGLLKYEKALEIQRRYVTEFIGGKRPQSLLFCQHPAVLTLGRSSHEGNILFPQKDILAQGINIVHIDRGGDITLHAPGQQVVYPILDLNFQGKDLHRYLFLLEQVGIDLLNDFGILADRILGKIGVYVDGEKIMSIGVGVRKWVSYHGLAININTDLKYFSLIRPCGLDVSMTSLAHIKGRMIDMDDVKAKMVTHLAKVFHLDIVEDKKI